MALRTTGISNLLAPGLRKVFFETYEALAKNKEYNQVFNIDRIERNYVEDAEMVGFGIMPRKPQGKSIIYDEPFQSANVKRYTPDTFALGFRVTEEAQDDDLYGIIKKMPSGLGKSALQAEEVEAWSVFNRAFNTAYVGLDGLPLCSAAHLPVNLTSGASTFSNKPTTDVDVGISPLQSAIQNMDETLDDRDINVKLKPKLLLISPTNKWIAKELLLSEYKPYTGDNEINPLQGEGISYMVCHYFTDADQWFLVTDKSQHTLNVIWRKALTFDNDDDFNTGDALFKAVMRLIAGFTGWRGVYGSSGG